MNMHRDPRVRAAFDRIVARTPDIGPTPSPDQRPDADHGGPRRYGLIAVAASVVALGVAGLTVAATARDESSGPASAPPAPLTPATATPVAQTEPEPVISTPELRGPTSYPSNALDTPFDMPATATPRGGPTLFPILDPAAVSGAPVTAGLRYNGALVKPQTNAVVARIADDGSTTDFYTFVAGAGVNGYTDGVGISADASTPRITDIGGYGYAAWTIDDVPVLVMAPDPAALLDDPAFSLTVGSDDNGDATVDFASLPPGFELLVEPQRFNREAAMATLLIGSSSDPGAIVGNVSASLDNPLTNLNLTEGSTITPSQVGGAGAWIVSFPDFDGRTVVWSPNDTTWVALNWTGSQDDLLALANAVTFTNNVAEWMTRYGVDLPSIEFDGTTAAG